MSTPRKTRGRDRRSRRSDDACGTGLAAGMTAAGI
jgi:hypothetical protein